MQENNFSYILLRLFFHTFHFPILIYYKKFGDIANFSYLCRI